MDDSEEPPVVRELNSRWEFLSLYITQYTQLFCVSPLCAQHFGQIIITLMKFRHSKYAKRGEISQCSCWICRLIRAYGTSVNLEVQAN